MNILNVFFVIVLIMKINPWVIAGTIKNTKNLDSIHIETISYKKKKKKKYTISLVQKMSEESDSRKFVLWRLDTTIQDNLKIQKNVYFPSMLETIVTDCEKNKKCILQRTIPLLLALSGDAVLLPARLILKPIHNYNLNNDFKIMKKAENEDVIVSPRRFNRILKLLITDEIIAIDTI